MRLPVQSQPVTRNSTHLGCQAMTRSYLNNGMIPSDTCVSATIKNSEACTILPVVGSKCISVPSWVPEGSLVEVCIDVCTKKLGIPTGACGIIKVASQQVAKECFGAC